MQHTQRERKKWISLRFFVRTLDLQCRMSSVSYSEELVETSGRDRTAGLWLIKCTVHLKLQPNIFALLLMRGLFSSRPLGKKTCDHTYQPHISTWHHAKSLIMVTVVNQRFSGSVWGEAMLCIEGDGMRWRGSQSGSRYNSLWEMEHITDYYCFSLLKPKLSSSPTPTAIRLSFKFHR